MNYNYLFLLILLINPFEGFSQNSSESSAIDKDNGILGFVLGEKASNQPHPLRKNGKYQKLRQFLPNEPIEDYNGIALKSVKLHFHSEQLHSILIRTEGEGNGKQMLNVIQGKYGLGESMDAMGSQFIWRGEKVSLVYTKNLMSGTGDFYFVDLSTHKMYKGMLYDRKWNDEYEPQK